MGDTYNVICNTLLKETQKRREAYSKVKTRFGFLFKKIVSIN